MELSELDMGSMHSSVARAYANGALIRAVNDASAGHTESTKSHVNGIMEPGIHTACLRTSAACYSVSLGR